MRDEIIEHILQLEQEHDIQILLATESGSRAWGCPSPDSDYDIRIIYKRAKEHYLEIDDKPDTINYFHGKLLDINGWDIKKTLKLIRKSNATPFEWAQSPIVYKEVDEFKNTILRLCRRYFQPRHTVNHYKGIATNSYLSNDLRGKIELKKLFYILRPIMAANWIIEKNEVPPMNIPKLIEIIQDTEISAHIKELVELKSSVNEDYIHKTKPLITRYIDDQFEIINSAQIEDNSFPSNSVLLNQTFMQIIEA